MRMLNSEESYNMRRLLSDNKDTKGGTTYYAF